MHCIQISELPSCKINTKNNGRAEVGKNSAKMNSLYFANIIHKYKLIAGCANNKNQKKL